jgi:hypothetical protein
MVVGVHSVIPQVKLSQGSSRGWARLFAVLYDPFLWVGERAGLRAHRKELLGQARGCTLEMVAAPA